MWLVSISCQIYSIHQVPLGVFFPFVQNNLMRPSDRTTSHNQDLVLTNCLPKRISRSKRAAIRSRWAAVGTGCKAMRLLPAFRGADHGVVSPHVRPHARSLGRWPVALARRCYANKYDTDKAKYAKAVGAKLLYFEELSLVKMGIPICNPSWDTPPNRPKLTLQRAFSPTRNSSRSSCCVSRDERQLKVTSSGVILEICRKGRCVVKRALKESQSNR